MNDLPQAWRRNFDVYERIERLGIDLKTREEVLPPPKGRRICMVAITPSGLVFTSGTAGGRGAVTNDDGDVEEGFAAGREAGESHIRTLHWALDPEGSLNDVWYCVKCIGMVNSAGGGAFSKSPQVVDGYTKVFHDVLGGPSPIPRSTARTPPCRAGTPARPWPASTCPVTCASSPR